MYCRFPVSSVDRKTMQGEYDNIWVYPVYGDITYDCTNEYVRLIENVVMVIRRVNICQYMMNWAFV